MTSYFDEHNCEPLPDGQAPNHLLHLARLLIDGGYGSFDSEFNRFFNASNLSPPASIEFVKNLKIVQISQLEKDAKCPICISSFDAGDTINELPCLHHFHSKCILVWLEKTNSCPVCRHELPTDDKNYEEYKKQKAREEQRKLDLESLHNSMFG